VASWSDHYRYDKYLFVHAAETVFAARVNQASLTYPIRQVEYDSVTTGAYGDIQIGQAILFGSSAGASDLGRQRIRSAPDADTIFFGWSPRGIRDGAVNLADDAYITVLDDYRAWSRVQRITKKGVLYKDYDIAIADGTPSPPVANGGEAVAQLVDGSNQITIDFDGSNSFVTAPGASISTYAWDFGDGTPASAATATVSGVVFPTGFRWVHLTVTDDNGKTHTHHIPVLAASPSGAGQNVITQFEVTTQTLRQDGQSIAFSIFADLPNTTYYDGCLVIYFETEYYDNVEAYLAGPTDRENVKFVGWHDVESESLNTSEATYTTGLEINCVDIGGRMRQLPAFPQVVLRDASPATWLELDTANTDRYIHYLLHWHSTVLDIAPFTWSGTGETYALPRFQSPGQNLWEQVSFRAQSIAHALTVTQRGALGITPDPMLQDAGDRTATVIVDIDETQWSNITYTHTRPPRVYWLWGNAVVASTDEADAANMRIRGVYCIAPGRAPGQGENEQTQGEQLVNATTPQDELNAREGHRYAARLNPFETYYEVELVPSGDAGIEPALMQWVRLTIPPDLAGKRGASFTLERFLPFEVEIVHNNVTQTKTYLPLLERETEGTPAATSVPDTGNVLPDTPSPSDWPFIYTDALDSSELQRGQGTIAAFDSAGNLHITSDFTTPAEAGGPTWTTTDLTGLSPALAGTYLCMVGDPFSPLYLGAGDTVNGWILTSTGIYSITDVFGVSGGPTLTLQHTHATPNADYGFIATGVGVQNWVVVAINYTNTVGTKCIRTTDGGSTWTESVISSHYNTNATFGLPHSPPLYPSSFVAGLVYAGAHTATGVNPAGDLYRSTDYGATWAVASTPDVNFQNFNGGTFNIPWHDNAGQLLCYSGGWNAGTAYIRRTESDGVTITDITPGGGDWGCIYGFWQLSVCVNNRQRVAVAAWKPVGPGLDQRAVFVSTNAGDTWTQATDTVVGPGTGGLYFCAVAGNDANTIYAWGDSLNIIYSEDFGLTWDTKTGNLSGSDDIVNILGGG